MPVRLPGAEDLGGAPSARSGRPIASVDTSAFGRGVAQLGAGVFSLAGGIEKAQERSKAEVDQAQAFDTQRRFLEFQSSQETALDDMGQKAQPGAFGFKEAYQGDYLKSAKEFFRTVPDALKPEYEVRLFQAEDNLTGKAQTFERTQRASYYASQVADGLTTIENKLYKNPKNFDENLWEGNNFIDNLPDEDVSPIQKEALRRDWKTKAQLASLNGMSPMERKQVLGEGTLRNDAPSPGMAAQETRSMSGDVRATIVAAAEKYGVDPNTMLRVAYLESTGNPKAKNPKSSAGGLFQQTDANAKEYGVADRFDAEQSADGAARFMRDNAAYLSKILGRAPTAGELYLAHQQGAGGAAKLLSNPDAKAVDAVGRKAVIDNGGNVNMTAGEFAAKWVEKGGGSVDPRFADVPYDVREKVIAGADKEIAQQETAQKAADTARYEQIKDALSLGIETGDVNTETEILGAPLNDGDKATLLRSYRAKNKEDADARALIGAVQARDGSVTINPFDTKQTATADKAFGMVLDSAADGDQNALAMGWIQQTKYIPRQVQAVLRQGASATDATDLSHAMILADGLEKAAPTSFQQFEGSDDVRNKLAVYRSLVNDRGMSGEEAAAKMLAMNDPMKKVSRDVLKPEATKFVKGLGLSDVTNAFDPGVFNFEPGAGLMPAQQNALLSEYRSIAEERFYETGDASAAKALALADLKKTWGVSSVSGSSQLMRLPPENFYPASGAGAPSHEYLREDALKTAKDYVADVEPGRKVKNVALLADPRTRADIEAGRPPRYRLFYSYQEDGQTLYDEVFAGPWGIDKSTLDGMLQKERDATQAKFNERRQVADKANEAVRQGDAIAERALVETPGPDWMKARAAEGAREAGRIGAAGVKIDEGGDVRRAATQKRIETYQKQRDQTLKRSQENIRKLFPTMGVKVQ